MKEYAIYPFEYMNITQNWNQGNHIPHWKKSTDYSDKPWDEACKDSGRDYFIPQNDFIVEEVLGLNSNITNSVRLKSVNKLYLPYKVDADYLYLTLTHMNEDNLQQVKKGQILKKGTKILLEGTDGPATGNHFHVTANLGGYHGLLKNSNGAWCYTYDKSLLPEEAFYIDTNFTIIKNSNGSKFQNIPIEKFGTPVLRNELVDQVEVLADNLRARNSAAGEIIGYVKKGVYDILESKFLNGCEWIRAEEHLWFAFSNSWAKKHYLKPIEELPIEQDQDNSKIGDTENNPPKNSIFAILIKIIKNIFKIKS